MSNLQPYRTAAIVKPNEKKLHGLIRKPKPIIHKCGYPGFWKRLFYCLTFRPIRVGSVYRCPQCKKIKEFYAPGYGEVLGKWSLSTIEDWKSAGGDT